MTYTLGITVEQVITLAYKALVANDKEELIEMARLHNECIDHYVKVELRRHFGTDKINVTQWFEGQRLIGEQNFYKKGHAIQTAIRAMGIDCKMDMQSNKLHCPAINIFAY